MRARFRVELPGDTSGDVVLELAPETPVHGIAEALTQHFRLPVAADARVWAVHSPRIGRWLEPGEPWSATGIRTGDQLRLGLRDAPTAGVQGSTAGVVRLVVREGPAMGRRIDLGPGSHVVGRGADADIVLDDRWMSARHLRLSIGAGTAEVSDLGSSNGTRVGDVRITGSRSLGPGELVKAGHTTFSIEGMGVRLDGMAPPAAAELVILTGPASGRTFRLADGDHLVGRDAGCDVRIDDPYLSGLHVRLRVSGAGTSIVAAPGRNGTHVNGRPVSIPHAIAPEDVIRAGRSSFAITTTGRSAVPAGTRGTISGGTVEAAIAEDGHIPFNRPPRIGRSFDPPKLSLEAPPPDPEKPRLPMIAALLPLIGGAAFIIIYMLTKEEGKAIPPFLWLGVIFMLLSPAMAVGSTLESRRSGRVKFREKEAKYRDKIAAVEADLSAQWQQEQAERVQGAPAPEDVFDRAMHLRSNLWERRADDRDFLQLRLGTADQPSELAVAIASGGNEALREEAEAAFSRYATVPGEPATFEMTTLGLVGMVGAPELLAGPARWLLVQAATLHSPRDLVMAVAVPRDRRAHWEWVKWLPHASPESSPTGRALVAADAGEAEALAGQLIGLIRDRQPMARESFGGERQVWRPCVLFLLDESVAPDLAIVDELMSEGPRHGVYTIWLGARRASVPGHAGALVEIATPAEATVTYALTGTRLERVAVESADATTADRVGIALTPIRDATASAAEAGLPRRVSLLELIGVTDLTADRILERWSEAKPQLAATVGVSAAGPLVIDLERDGPHGLIAGTTGSGKSELLQSLVASLSIALPPSRVTWLLVDAKGGAAFKDCAQLPHTVGYVTELDEHLSRRALISLEAEVRRRESVLRDAGARSVQELAVRDPERALPSLVLLVDEFATLAREIPEFVDGVVDVAQRGRSLGIHMILATQSPAGVVTGKIRANTNLRLALRTTNAGESSDVIEAPNASNIPPELPGRAFVLTGRDAAGRARLAEFQSAFVGGTTRATASSNEIVVSDFVFGAPADVHRSVWGRQHLTEEDTDFERIVGAIRGAAARTKLPQTPTIWTIPLPEVLPLGEVDVAHGPDSDPASVAAIGLIDEPALQRQDPYRLDFEQDGSILVYGTSGAGKTTLLRTTAVALATQCSPEDVNIYGLDFATRGLKMLEALPHCGSVVLGEEQELVEHLFGMVRGHIARRKELFMQAGVATLGEYRRRVPEGAKVPRIVVLLDSYAGFVAAFDRVNVGELIQELPRLIGDGRPLGIHFVISADRRGAVPGAVAGLIPRTVVLMLADENEYAMLGLRPAAYRGVALPPGRGFVEDGLDFQCAVVDADPSGSGQSAAIDRIGSTLRERFGALGAPPVRTLPLRFPQSQLGVASAPMRALVGLGDEDLEAVEIDLADGHFLVSGPYRSGRSTALATICASLRDVAPDLEMVLLAPRRSPLTDLDLWTSIARGVEECDRSATDLAERLDRSPESPARPLVVIVDDADELVETPGAQVLERVVKRGRDAGVHVAAAGETHALHRVFSGWIRELRKDKNGLLLVPDMDVDGDLVGARLPRQAKRIYPPGRGFLVVRGSPKLIHVADHWYVDPS